MKYTCSLYKYIRMYLYIVQVRNFPLTTMYKYGVITPYLYIILEHMYTVHHSTSPRNQVQVQWHQLLCTSASTRYNVHRILVHSTMYVHMLYNVVSTCITVPVYSLVSRLALALQYGLVPVRAYLYRYRVRVLDYDLKNVHRTRTMYYSSTHVHTGTCRYMYMQSICMCACV